MVVFHEGCPAALPSNSRLEAAVDVGLAGDRVSRRSPTAPQPRTVAFRDKDADA